MALMSEMIMEGTSYGGKLDRSYDHENGAGLIAMESAEALRDIFEASFYSPETCAIQAALEGASCVEESTQAAIMEAAVKSAFEKIKQFFINLKDKVKEFLHNIKRYLTGIFSNDEKWVKTYEKELKALNSSDLKDYKVKMYNYTIEPPTSKADIAASGDELMKTVNAKISTIKASSHDKDTQEKDEDTIKDEAEKLYLEFIKDMVGKSIDSEELDKELWSLMRGGADNDSDKEDVVVSSKLTNMIETLKKATKDISAYDTMISKTESLYGKAIKLVNDADKKVAGWKTDNNGIATVDGNSYNSAAISYITNSLRALSSTLSKEQTAANKYNNACKSALVERNSAYKSALMGAFAYARKHKGGK